MPFEGHIPHVMNAFLLQTIKKTSNLSASFHVTVASNHRLGGGIKYLALLTSYASLTHVLSSEENVVGIDDVQLFSSKI